MSSCLLGFPTSPHSTHSREPETRDWPTYQRARRPASARCQLASALADSRKVNKHFAKIAKLPKFRGEQHTEVADDVAYITTTPESIIRFSATTTTVLTVNNNRAKHTDLQRNQKRREKKRTGRKSNAQGSATTASEEHQQTGFRLLWCFSLQIAREVSRANSSSKTINERQTVDILRKIVQFFLESL